MKVTGSVRISVLAALAVAAAGNICAQTAPTMPAVLLPGSDLPGSSATPGLPYSATRTMTRVQTLADGTTITHTTVQKEARDSQGRTYHADQPELGGGNSRLRALTIYTVIDPVKRIAMHWNSNNNTVTVNHFPQAHPVNPAPVPQNNQATAPVLPRAPQNSSDIQIDDLGTQNINGVLAHGRRITRIVPAGKEGNNQQITATTETWFSSELRINVLVISDDPRYGNTRTELSGIDLNEPDPNLFEPPAGYTVQELEPVQPQANTNLQ
jgi:hypothetical protein